MARYDKGILYRKGGGCSPALRTSGFEILDPMNMSTSSFIRAVSIFHLATENGNVINQKFVNY